MVKTEGALRLHDISLHILDLIENSLHAGASVVGITVDIDKTADLMWVCVEDNGEGMQSTPEQVLNPFYTTSGSKRVGLGLSFFKAAAEMAGGQLTVSRSEELGGVSIMAKMKLTHIDRPPLGDLAATISTMVLANPSLDFQLSLRSSERNFTFRLSDFARGCGLNAEANVHLASSAYELLRTELEEWKKSELSGSSGQWHPTEELSLCTDLS
jgi:signal transduction histidine kinase